MKELIKEYQSVLITSIASMFVFICVYSVVPIVVREAENNKVNNNALDVIQEDNSEYRISLKYPNGNKIRLVKGEEFSIGEYIKIVDSDKDEISNYKYSLKVNGSSVEKLNTDTCGGYQLCAEIIYRGNKLQGDLQIIIEER